MKVQVKENKFRLLADFIYSNDFAVLECHCECFGESHPTGDEISNEWRDVAVRVEYFSVITLSKYLFKAP